MDAAGIDAFRSTFERSVRKIANVPDDWEYRCMWLQNDDFRVVQNFEADGEARIISNGSRSDHPGVWHATFFISPSAIEQIRASQKEP